MGLEKPVHGSRCCGFAIGAGVRMSGSGGKEGSTNNRKREPKIHPLGFRRWKTISVPERVWWQHGVLPEHHPAAKRLAEQSDVFRRAIEGMEREVIRGKSTPNDLTLTEWVETRFGPNNFPPIAAVGIFAWCWYSFPSTSRTVLALLLPVHSTAFTCVAGITGIVLLLAALIHPPTPTDAVRRAMVLYVATALGYPLAAVLAACGFGAASVAIEGIAMAMGLGAVWFWKDLNLELAAAKRCRHLLTRCFLAWRRVFTVLCCLSVGLRALLWKTVVAYVQHIHKRGLSTFLARTSPQMPLMGDPGALAVVGCLVTLLYVLYSMVFSTFVTDVGRYPYARKITSPPTLLLQAKGVLVAIPPRQDVLTDPRGGLPHPAARKIGKPDRPGQKENMPDMEYPWLFRQLDELESQGRFQGMYRRTGFKTNPLSTWAIFAEIPEDKSFTDSVHVVNPAKASEKRIQSILEEGQRRLAQSQDLHGKERNAAQPYIDENPDADFFDADHPTDEGENDPDDLPVTLYDSSDDDIEWMFFEPDKDDPKTTTLLS